MPQVHPSELSRAQQSLVPPWTAPAIATTGGHSRPRLAHLQGRDEDRWVMEGGPAGARPRGCQPLPPSLTAVLVVGAAVLSHTENGRVPTRHLPNFSY